MAFLHDKIVAVFGKRAINQTLVPNHISDNLKPGYGQRPYQTESFQRYILFSGRILKFHHIAKP